MKLYSPLRLFVFGTLTLALLGISPAQTVNPSIPGTWQLEFQDDFTGSVLDGTKWRLGQHWSGMAGAAGVSPENVTVSGGFLKIKAEQRTISYGGTSYSYAAGEVSTFGTFRRQHGYFEARLKYPAVKGLWPAFWLMPDRGQYGWAGNYRRAYLKFDLSSANIASVGSATLKLKVTAVESGGANNVVFMKLADDSWSESAITWNNKPTPNPVWIAQRWNQAVAGQDMSVDVTTYVSQQMAGDKKISFVLADTFMKTKAVTFASRQAAVQADRPRLEIDGITYYATEDATVQWGDYANTNYGSTATLVVKDDWGDTATTFNGGMEIDAMESLGIWGSHKIQHALHWDGYGAQHQTINWPNITYPPSADGFHTYGVYWEAGLLEFYVDGMKTGEWSNSRVMSVPAYAILSLQIGGWDGNNGGVQVNGQSLEVDWVRVWSGTRTAPTTLTTVDNANASATGSTGTWIVASTAPGYYGTNYAHDGNTNKGASSFTFKPTLTVSGDYAIYARWPADPNRATNVPADVMTFDGSVKTITLNQTTNGGQWNLLGGFSLAASNAKLTLRNQGTNGYVVADAVKFAAPSAATTLQIDNMDAANVVKTGAWTDSAFTPGYLGTNYAHDGNIDKGTKSFTFKPTLGAVGDYLIYARWPADTNRASNVPIDIKTAAGSVAQVQVDQRTKSNQWVLLGGYRLAPNTAEITIRTTGTDGFVVADGIKLVPVSAQ